MRDINRRFGLTIVLITHEMGVVRAIADRVVVLDDGRVVEEGPVWRVFAAPRHATTLSLLRAYQPSLPHGLAARLKPGAGRRTVVKTLVVGDEARRPLLAELALATGAQAELLHGGVDTVQDTPIGALFLALDAGDAAAFAAALAFLRQHTSEAEVLGHVVDVA